MIFQYTVQQVLSGDKTKTSRLVKPHDTAVIGSDGKIEAVLSGGRDKYRVGKTYAVQPARTQPAVARIRLLGIERQVVSETNKSDAQAEGFSSRQEFFAQWDEIHGAGKRDADVWMLEFELVKDEAQSVE
jgi:hypothetical protein